MIRRFCLLLLLFPSYLMSQGPGDALRFDGSTSYVTGGNIDFAFTNALTVTSWIKWNQNPPGGVAHATVTALNSSTGSGDDGQFWLQHDNNNGSFQFAVQTSSGRRVVSSTTTPVAGNWYHLSGSFDGATLRLYVNGELEATDTLSGTVRPLSQDDVFSIGQWSNSSGNWRRINADIDEVRVWNSARSQTQIREMMCQHLAGSETGLGGYWRFDSPPGSSIPDDGPNGRNLSAGTSPPTWVCSSAPVGNASTFRYATNWNNETVSLAHPQGDYVEVTNITASPAAVFIYRIDGPASDPTPPSNFSVISPLRHWGIFIVGGGNVSFRTRYYYRDNSGQGHPGIGNENMLRLALRDDDCGNWSRSNSPPNTGAHYLELNNPHNRPQFQLVLSSLNNNNTLDYSTYRWTGGNGNWALSANWTPTRNSPAVEDILIFDNDGNAPVTVTEVPSETVLRIRVENAADVTLQTAQANTLTLSGSHGDGLLIENGAMLTLDGQHALALRLSVHATATVRGVLATSGSGAHSIDAVDVHAIGIASGGIFRHAAAGAPFTDSGTAHAVIFNSGAHFEFLSTFSSALPPFGLAAPSSKVSFLPGSTYVQGSTLAGSLDLNGREYANLLFSFSTSYAVTTAFTGLTLIDTLEIESGSTLEFAAASAGSGTLHIFGDVFVDGALSFSSDPSVQHSLRFAGTEPQYIRGNGTLTFPDNLDGIVLDAVELRLGRDLLIEADLHLESGICNIETYTLTLYNHLSHVDGTLTGDQTSSLVFAGNAVHSSCPQTTTGNLTIDRQATITLDGTMTVNSLLTLSNGTLDIRQDTLILNGVCSVTNGTLTGGNSAHLLLGGVAQTALPTIELASLILDKSGGAYLTGPLVLHSSLLFSDGRLDLQAYDMTMHATAGISGTPSSASMIVTSGSGMLRRVWTSDGSFTFPLGDETGTPDYTPLTVTLSGGSYAAGATVGAAVFNARHPAHNDPSHYLNRYWETERDGISGATLAVSARYVESDIVGFEQRIAAAAWSGSGWSFHGPTDGTNNILTYTNPGAFASFTGKDEFPFLAASVTHGDWHDLGTWDIGRIPLESDSVIVHHQVAIDAQAGCAGLSISSAGVLTHASSQAPLQIRGGWTNDGDFQAGTFIPVSMAGRPDTVFGITGSSLTVFHILNLSAATSLLQDITCEGELLLPSGGALYGGTATLTLLAAPTTSIIDGAWYPEASTVLLAGNGTQHIPSMTYFNLGVSATSGIQDRLLQGDIVIEGTLSVLPGSHVRFDDHHIELRGFNPLVVNGGQLDPGTSSVLYSRPDSQRIAATGYHHLGFAATGTPLSLPVGKTLLGDIHVYGNLTVDSLVTVYTGNSTMHLQGDLLFPSPPSGVALGPAGRIDWNGGGGCGTLRFFGQGNSLLTSNTDGTVTDICNLVVEKHAVTDTVSFSLAPGSTMLRIADGANVTVQSGVLDYRAIPLYPEQTELGTLTITASGVIRTSGMNNFPVHRQGSVARFATNALQSGSVVEFYGGNQEIPGSDRNINSYGTIVIGGDGMKSMTDDIAVMDTLLLESGSTLSGSGHSIYYGANATLKYQLADDSIPARQQTQTTGDEFPSANGPTHLSLSNRKGVQLDASRTISGTLVFDDGRLHLGGHDLSLGSTAAIQGAGADRCVVTNGTGQLRLHGVSTLSAFYPVATIDAITGDTTYNPVTITNAGTADAFALRVQPSIDSPPMFTDDLVHRQWNVEKATPGGGNVTIQFQWNAGEQGSSFDPGGSVVVNYHDNTWLEESAAVSGADPYTATASFGIISRYYVAMSSPLPVELHAFSASRDGSDVHLQWTTATELFNEGFEIQRSHDNTQWHVLSFIEGHGTTYSPRQYTYTDRLTGALLPSPLLYYRLRQIDTDGSFTYSPVVSVRMDRPLPHLTLGSFPQPARGHTTISIHIPERLPVVLEFYDAMGRKVRTQVDGTVLSAGTHRFPVTMHTWPTGVYYCVLRTPEALITHRLFLLR